LEGFVHEGLLLRLTLFLRNELDVLLSSPADVCPCHLTYLDSSLTVVLDDVPSDVWFSLQPSGVDAVQATRADVVSPDVRGTTGASVMTAKSYAVFVGLDD
jgi:hypothetical protein